MRPITDWCRHRAVFFDDSGYYVGRQKIKFTDKTFAYKERLYNFLPVQSTWFKIDFMFWKTKYYFYNINDPMPFLIDKKCEPVLNGVVYKNIIDSDLIKKLNDIPRNPLLALLTPRNIILLVIIGGAIYYFSTGGTIT